MGNVHMEASQVNYRGGDTKMSVEEAIKAGSSYTLPIAGAETLGGVKIGSGLAINSETGVVSADSQLPADPETDGVKVLTATTTSGETVKSWEDPETMGIQFSTTEQKTRYKWLNGEDIYTKTLYFETPIEVGNTWVNTSEPSASYGVILGCFASKSTGTYYGVFSMDKGQDFLQLLQSRGVSISVSYVTFFYTKVTV